MLILDKPRSWPEKIIEKLNEPSVLQLFHQHCFMEEIVNDKNIIDIFHEVDAYIKSQGLAGYHCTKQLPGSSFADTGLVTLDFDSHHIKTLRVLSEHVSLSDELYCRISERLKLWRENYSGNREKMIWFCLERHSVLGSDTNNFFRYFGGEAVYFAFLDDQEVALILESIGEPVVVEAKLDKSDITVSLEWSYGRTLCSFFAHEVNHEFEIEPLAGYISSSISKDRIIEVHPYSNFISSVDEKR